MSDITLYGCPKACSLVSHIALEMMGAPFTYRFVDLFEGEQRSAAFLALSPRGKVPTLLAYGLPMTETIAILHWLAAKFPEAGLLPLPGTDLHLQALSDLAWFASGIHPTMTRVLMPSRFLETRDAQSALQAIAIPALGAEFAIVNERLADREWWLGERTALDAYLFWIWARIGEGPLDLSGYTHYARHARRMLAIPQVQAVLDRERSYLPCFEQLEAVLA